MKNLFHLLQTNQVGSTMVQLPITLAIIGGLIAASTSASEVLPEARDTRRAADTYQVTQALGIYYDDQLSYPIYTSSNATASWEFLADNLQPTYVQELPNDPQLEEGKSYRYWSDGQVAKVFYQPETSDDEQERWSY